MKIISSRDNPLYKELKHLATSSQARRKAGRTLLDGVHLCEAYLQSGRTPPHCVVSQESLSDHEVAAILRQCEGKDVQCISLPEQLYHTLSQVEHGVGLMFVIDIPAVKTVQLIQRPAVLLDNLQDPGNLGSILRSAAAAGIVDVFCGSGTAFAWSPKVLRAGMGAHFALNIVENANLHALIAQAEIPVLATSSHASECLYDVDLKEAVAWLFGHEGQGVSHDLLTAATRTVSIPHLGDIESLNVAASAAVCFFEQVRQKTT